MFACDAYFVFVAEGLYVLQVMELGRLVVLATIIFMAQNLCSAAVALDPKMPSPPTQFL